VEVKGQGEGEMGAKEQREGRETSVGSLSIGVRKVVPCAMSATRSRNKRDSADVENKCEIRVDGHLIRIQHSRSGIQQRPWIRTS